MPSVVWVITKDFTGSNNSAVGVYGPEGSNPYQNMRFKFRMYDDDNTLCYEGATNALDDELGDEEAVFAPLDNFGAPNAGCTRIDYYNPENDKWETA